MKLDLLDIYTDYLISQNQQATATGLSNLLDGQISHDKITPFLNNNPGGSKELWQYVKKQVHHLEQDKGGVLIIDDTIEEKPYTDEYEIVCWHFSHTQGRCVKGINLLSCLISYGDYTFPIGFEVIKKDMHFCDVKTKKEKRQSSITKNQHFRALIQQAAANQVKFEYVLADNWFGAKDNMEFIHYKLKKMFVFGIKSNRLIAFSEEERKKGQYQNLNTFNFKDGDKRIVWLKELVFPVALITKIFKNEDGSTGVPHFVTNDLNHDSDPIYEVYHKRWRIEEYHKSIKQNTSLEKSPTKIARSQRNHIFASLIAYCKLEFLKIKTLLNHFALKYKLILKANQMAYQELQILQRNFMSA
ncbi:transposase [Neochlamydia sp. S13]|uniref:IS701 family transposase n=1 Tax=Neochlamydia sp. S13 TaxID=1353976 RepID=UPI0005A876F8|nr:transposase [Neochlamydia sp. S13]BBI17607.1 transposase IS4 family protein [Neochlamydia sp. S13]